MSNVLSSRQFGRYLEVEIRDFKSQTKTTISNEFEIEFEFFKSLDQVTEDDSGKIKIYGLTPERIKALQEGGGEVILRCKYRYAEVQVLFQAYISRCYAEVSNNTTLTTIECSANLMNYYQTGTIASESHTTIADFIASLGEKLGAVQTVIFLPDIRNSDYPESVVNNLREFISEADVRLSSVGNYQEILEDFCSGIGFDSIRENLPSGGFVLGFYLNDSGAARMIQEINLGYRRVKRNVSKPSQKSNIEFSSLKESQEADSNSREYTTLTEKTGLISVKIEYKIATAYADQVLYDHEVETVQSQEKGMNLEARLEKSRAREAEKVRKAAEKGKVYTPKSSTYTRTKKVNRKYARVKALLNPNIKPQSIIAVPESVSLLRSTGQVVSVFEESEYFEDELEDFDDALAVLRVRSVAFKGNNKRNDWIMDIYAEDLSKSRELTEVELTQLQRVNSPEDVLIDDGSGVGGGYGDEQ